MSQFTTPKIFSKSECQNLRMYLNQKMKEIEAETGLRFRVGNMVYGDLSVNIKVSSFIPTSSTDKSLSPRELEVKQNLKTHGWKFSLTEADYGKTILMNGDEMTLIGCTNRYGKHPLVVKSSNTGKIYRISQNVKFTN